MGKEVWYKDRFDDSFIITPSSHSIYVHCDNIIEHVTYLELKNEGKYVATLWKSNTVVYEGDDFRSNKHQSDFWNPEGSYDILED